MNSVIETILNHRSIRAFQDQAVPANHVELIVQAAQMASSSSFRQSYTIIGITDPEIKQEITKRTQQAFIEKSGHLFIFCADLHRATVNATDEEVEQMTASLESTLMYQVSVIDATVAAQNAALAAESLGYGIVYLGSILRALDYLNDKLGLPERVMPLFGMAVGVPDERPEQKPRLPLQAVYHENKFQQDHVAYQRLLQEYDEQLLSYYQTRTANKQEKTWTETTIKMMSNPAPIELSAFIQHKGFNKK